MLSHVEKENKQKHKRENSNLLYAARDFSDKYDFALFTYLIKFVNLRLIASKKIPKFSI